SGVPWAHRKRMGRLWAFGATVWRFSIDARSLRHEAARPQDERDARRLGIVVGLLLGTALSALFVVGVATHEDGLAALAVQPQIAWLRGGSGLDGWTQDLAVPWSAGATIWGVLPVCLVGLGVYLGLCPGGIFTLKDKPADYQSRGRALAIYASVPLLWLAVGIGLLCGAMIAEAAA